MWIRGYVIRDNDIHKVFILQENPELEYYRDEFEKCAKRRGIYVYQTTKESEYV